MAGADLLTLYEAVCDAAGFHPISDSRVQKAQEIVKDLTSSRQLVPLVLGVIEQGVERDPRPQPSPRGRTGSD